MPALEVSGDWFDGGVREVGTPLRSSRSSRPPGPPAVCRRPTGGADSIRRAPLIRRRERGLDAHYSWGGDPQRVAAEYSHSGTADYFDFFRDVPRFSEGDSPEPRHPGPQRATGTVCLRSLANLPVDDHRVRRPHGQTRLQRPAERATGQPIASRGSNRRAVCAPNLGSTSRHRKPESRGTALAGVWVQL